jgi:hypothetical protein
MFHGYNAFNLISEANIKVNEEQVNCPRVITKREWTNKLLRSPPLEYATVISALPSKMEWDLHLPVVKTLFDDRYGPNLGEQEENDDIVWCREKTPPDEYEYHEDMIEEDYPEDTADCTTDEYDDDGYDPKYDAFYDDNEF